MTWDAPFTTSMLYVVDAQNGFSEECPRELPVAGGKGIVSIVNRLMTMPWKRIVASQDWHPNDHSSFAAQGGPYPPHCVMNTRGADFLWGLWSELFHTILRKGFRKDRDAYSAGLDHPGLFASWVGQFDAIYLAGICTNICVFETACDLVSAGHKNVLILEDACAALDLPADNPYHPATVRKTAEDLGIRYIKAGEILPPL